MGSTTFTVLNWLLLGIPWMVTKLFGGLTPGEYESIQDSILKHEVRLSLVAFANRKDFDEALQSLFPHPSQEAQRAEAERFLVKMNGLPGRYCFFASDRQLALVQQFDHDDDAPFVVNYLQDCRKDFLIHGRQYNGFTRWLYCEDCRGIFDTWADPWEEGEVSLSDTLDRDKRCPTCNGTKTKALDSDTSEKDVFEISRHMAKA